MGHWNEGVGDDGDDPVGQPTGTDDDDSEVAIEGHHEYVQHNGGVQFQEHEVTQHNGNMNGNENAEPKVLEVEIEVEDGAEEKEEEQEWDNTEEHATDQDTQLPNDEVLDASNVTGAADAAGAHESDRAIAVTSNSHVAHEKEDTQTSSNETETLPQPLSPEVGRRMNPMPPSHDIRDEVVDGDQTWASMSLASMEGGGVLSPAPRLACGLKIPVDGTGEESAEEDGKGEDSHAPHSPSGDSNLSSSRKRHHPESIAAADSRAASPSKRVHLITAHTGMDVEDPEKLGAVEAADAIIIKPPPPPSISKGSIIGGSVVGPTVGLNGGSTESAVTAKGESELELKDHQCPEPELEPASEDDRGIWSFTQDELARLRSSTPTANATELKDETVNALVEMSCSVSPNLYYVDSLSLSASSLTRGRRPSRLPEQLAFTSTPHKDTDADTDKVGNNNDQISKMVLAPAHLGNHWVLLRFQLQSHVVELFDSLPPENPPAGYMQLAKDRARSVVEFCMPRGHNGWSQWAWRDMSEISVPIQTNGVDCGIFTALGAIYLASGLGIPTETYGSVYIWRQIFCDVLEALRIYPLESPSTDDPQHCNHPQSSPWAEEFLGQDPVAVPRPPLPDSLASPSSSNDHSSSSSLSLTPTQQQAMHTDGVSMLLRVAESALSLYQGRLSELQRKYVDVKTVQNVLQTFSALARGNGPRLTELARLARAEQKRYERVARLYREVAAEEMSFASDASRGALLLPPEELDQSAVSSIKELDGFSVRWQDRECRLSRQIRVLERRMEVQKAVDDEITSAAVK